jgi:hypothetical protein
MADGKVSQADVILSTYDPPVLAAARRPAHKRQIRMV